MATGFARDIDKDVIRRAAKGQRRAQRQLFEVFYDPVYRLALAMTRNEADARDLVQDAFIKAFTALPSLHEPGAFGGWLKRLVVNLALDGFKGRRLEQSLDSAELAPDWSNATEQLAVLDDIDALLVRLPDLERALVWLYAVEGFEHRELATLFAMKEAAVRQRYRRALAKLAVWASNGDWQDAG